MADEDKEKAEKLAAAKKRFEQLKKEQAKKGKKTAAKKKDDKPKATEDDSAAAVADESVDANEAQESGTAVTKADDVEDSQDAIDDSEAKDVVKPSLSLASKQRSESFRQGLASPGAESQDVYRKQATRIEELEKELEAAQTQQSDSASRLLKAEEEIQGLREASSEVAELKNKASQVQRLETELASVHRQLSQSQQTAKGSARKTSSAGADLAKELESKTLSLESMALELSTAKSQIKTLQDTISERDATIKKVEDRAATAEKATETVKQELDALKVSLSFPSDAEDATKNDPEALSKRILVLESDLKSANANSLSTAERATSLEKKIEALTKLHRDAMTASQAKDKELIDLREQVRKRDRPSHVRDASEFELGDDETEHGALEARIRALEAENFDLRRGVWREKRAELQPGMGEGDYEDVDLNTPYTQQGRRGSSGILGRQSSSLQDVINSGITAFTGRTREPPRTTAHAREPSLGLLDDDDDGFDEEAFRLAQEEDAKRRLARIKEVKRGLDNWKGWRLELTDSRQGGIGAGRNCGPVFEV